MQSFALFISIAVFILGEVLWGGQKLKGPLTAKGSISSDKIGKHQGGCLEYER